MADDLVRILSLGFFGAMLFLVVTNGSQTAQILTSFGDVYSGGIKAVEGR
jgi:hypothetical protein